MSEDFELPVNLNGTQKIFPAKFIRMGYSYKIEIETGDEVLLFEPDEERNWRAVMQEGRRGENTTADPGLYKSIAQALDGLFR